MYNNCISKVPEYEHLDKLKLFILNDDIKSFKESIIFASAFNLQETLSQTIYRERKELFDIVLEKVAARVKSDSSNNIYAEVDYRFWFGSGMYCPDPYYALRLSDTFPTKKNIALHLAIILRNELVCHQLILAGADVNAFADRYEAKVSTRDMAKTSLEEAISCDNLELMCMLLYYGANVSDLQNRISSFMFSIVLERSEDIQSVLIDYEYDFNLCWKGMSTLFLAIKYDSPVTLEIIKRGANINYCNGIQNVVSLALDYNCSSKIFRVLWDEFDYEVWKISFSKSVLLRFLEKYKEMPTVWSEYLNIFVENEDKLRLDLEYHNNSYFFESDHLIANFYMCCFENKIPESSIASFIVHLLSHGAHIFKKDVDIIYREYFNETVTSLIDLLLYMDIQNGDSYDSFMYFKYNAIPNLQQYMVNMALSPNIFFDSLKMLRRFYALNNDLQLEVLEILDTEDYKYNDCTEILQTSETFPSLLQLSRDSARKAICLKYNIRNSCSLYTVIKYLPLPKYVQNILLLDRNIYHL